jgi:hypothetical protein
MAKSILYIYITLISPKAPTNSDLLPPRKNKKSRFPSINKRETNQIVHEKKNGNIIQYDGQMRKVEEQRKYLRK